MSSLSLIPATVGALTPSGTRVSVYNVTAYGASGNGTHDDTSAIQAALDACGGGGGGVVYFPIGTYKVTAALTVFGDTHVLLDHAHVDFSTSATNTILFNAAGTLGSQVPLASDTAVNGTSVAVGSGAESGFAAEDFVLIGSSAYFETRTLIYGAGTGQRIGEINRVLSTAAGTLNLKRYLQGGWTNASGVDKLTYKTADSAFAAKITPVENITFEGGTITGRAQGVGSGTSSTQGAISIQYGRNVRVRNVRIEECAYTGINLRSCWDSVIDGISVYRCWNTNNGYAVTCGDASQDCTMTNSYVSRCRHAFTTTSNGGTYGVVRRITVSQNKHVDSNSTGDAFDTHAAAENISFIGNTVWSSGGQGINVECASATVIGNTIYQASLNGIGCHNETLAPTNFVISGNVVHRVLTAGKHGIVYNPPVTSGAEPETRGVTITGNTVTNVPGVGIYVGGSGGSGTVTDVSVTGNHVSNAQSLTACIYVQSGSNCAVTGNVIQSVPATGVGVRMSGSKNTCAGNAISFASLSSGIGIYAVSGAVDCTITGNTVTNGGHGVTLDNGASYCTVMGNNLRGCTTPLTVGSGTGHITTTADNSGAYNRT